MSKPKKLSLLVAAGAGYVLGARAGRQRYEQIVAGARRFAGNPKVQAAAGKARETVGHHGDHDDDSARPSTPAGQPLS
ncbi:hypothetical protein [Nocardioides dilutus]